MKINFKSISVKIIVPIFLLLTVFTVLLATLVNNSVEKHWLANSESTINCDADIAMDYINREMQVIEGLSGWKLF